VITVQFVKFFPIEPLALNLGMAVTTEAIGRPRVSGRMLDDQVVMTDAPTLLSVAVDLAITDYHDGQDAESAGKSGPEAVPTSWFVVGAGPTEDVMKEVVETVHQPLHFVIEPRLISVTSAKTDT
jgi:hypothetical protein